MPLSLRDALSLVAVVLLATGVIIISQPATAASGDIDGRAANIQGTILGGGVSTTEVTLPADGTPVDDGTPLSLGPNLPVLGIVSLSVESGTVESSCEGTPIGPEVEAHCQTTIEGLSVGLTGAPILSATTLEAHSTCTFDGSSVDCTDEGTTFTGLNALGEDFEDPEVGTSVDANLLGLVTVEVGINEQGASSFGSNGLEVTLLHISIEALGGEDLASFDIGVADTHLSNLQASPTISDITPGQGPASGGTEVTITGDDFVDGCTVTFDGAAGVGTTVESDTEITTTTPASAPGTADVVVSCPAGDSDPGNFTFTDDSGDGDDPSISNITPDEGPASGGTEVTITGDNFVVGCTVTFDGASGVGTTVESDTEITTTTPASDPGTADVVVSCPAGDSDPGNFTFTDDSGDGDGPSISGITPGAGPSTGGTDVTITGDNFANGCTVTFDGASGSGTSVDSSTQITTTTPPGDPGSASVVVSCPEGDSDPGTFVYFDESDDTPVIGDIDPDEGPPGGGTEVTITGFHFEDGCTVTFGEEDGVDVVVVSPTEIVVITPAHDPGTVDVIVSCPAGDSNPGEFTYSDGGQYGMIVPALAKEVEHGEDD